MTTEITLDDLKRTLDALVVELLSQAGISGPPVDARAVAASIGLTVARDVRQPGRARFVRLQEQSMSAGGSILVRPEPRPERLQWAIAHEIGESQMERGFRALAIDPREAGDAARERLANQFANRLLLPSEWFERDAVNCDWDLFALKARYGTASHELIARRMLDFEPRAIITVFDNEQTTWRQSNVSGRVPPLTALERGCWTHVATTGTPQVQTEPTGAVQGWPIHEPSWRREILRTELFDME